MSPEVILWGFGIVAAAIGTLFMLHINHAKDCATLRSTVERIDREIGDHETGIRGQLHQHRSNLVKLAGKLGALDVIE